MKTNLVRILTRAAAFGRSVAGSKDHAYPPKTMKPTSLVRMLAGSLALLFVSTTTSFAQLSYSANNTLAPITVDGALTESVWSTTTAVSELVLGTAPNNTVTFAALWTSTYLYVGVRVLDSALWNDSINIWEDDSVEVYIDGNHNHAASYELTGGANGTGNDRQFTKAWNDSGLGGIGSQTGVLHGWAAITGGYTIEMAIPWSNVNVTGAAGLQIGFDVGCNDDDNGGTTRESQLMWAGDQFNSANTAAFGHLTLSATTVGGAPEVNVTGAGLTISDGDTTPQTADGTDFGSTDITSGTISKVFNIQNTGNIALTLGTVTAGGDFSISVQPPVSIAAGGNANFTVLFNPSATGLLTATVSFTNNDTAAPSESPYNFSIQGTGTTTSGTYTAFNTLAPMTVDGALTESVWSTTEVVSKLVQGTSANNTVTFAALWTSTYLYVGVRVLDSALWNDSINIWEDDSVEVYIDGNHNHATSYELTGGANGLGNDRQFVKGWNDSGLGAGVGSQTGVVHGWAAITGGYTIEMAIPWSNVNVTGVANLTIGFDVGCNDDDNGGTTRESQVVWFGTANNSVNTTAFGHLTLSATTVGTGLPEVNVTGAGLTITDGDTSPQTADGTDFGSTDITSGTVSKVFNIQNTGNATLTLGSVTAGGDFSVTVQPPASIAAGGNANFTVVFNPSATGLRTATVSFTNNDTAAPSESPYNFSIQGTGTGGGETTPPTVTMTAPFNNSAVSGTITVRATASDNVGVVGVQFKLDGANLQAEDTTAPYTIQWNATAVSLGAHSLTAVARDAAGNSTTSSAINVTVKALLSITAYGANGGDTIDDTAAINSAISAAQSQGKSVHIPAGTFRYTTFRFDGITLTGDGPTSILYAPNQASSMIILNGNGPILKHLKVQVNGTSRTGADHSVFVEAATNFTIDNVEVTGSAAAAILTYGASSGKIINNYVHDTFADSIHNTHASHDIVVADNKVRNSGDDMVAVVGYLGDGQPYNILIQDNDTAFGRARGLSVIGGRDVTIQGNKIDDTTVCCAGIIVASEPSYNTYGVSNVLIKNNQLINNSGYTGHGAFLISGFNGNIDRVRFEGNTITDPVHDSIKLEGSNSNTALINNTMIDPEARGINIVSGSNVYCSGNTMNGGSTPGCGGTLNFTVTGSSLTY